MSTATEISRLSTARNTIRDKLVDLGLATSTSKLDTLATAVEGIANRGAVSATVQEGDTYTIPAGYHNGSGTVSGVAGGGNYSLQSKTTTPTKSQQSITPDSGYYGLSDVTVAAIPEAYQNVSSVTATAGDVLASKIIVNSAGETVTGTMPNVGTVTRTLDASTNNQSYTIPAGKHSGSGKVSITLETKTATPTESSQTVVPTAGKVLSSVTVNPIPSNYIVTSDATATEAQILEDATAYVDGELLTGTMPNNGATGGTISAKAGTVTIPAGYTSGGSVSISSTEQAKIISDNIKSGVSILGVSGSSTVVDTAISTGAASGVHIIEGKSAYVNGELVEGEIETLMPVTTSISTKAQAVSIPAGYYDMKGSVTISSTEQAKIISGNIKSGVTILGVSGSSKVVDTTVSEGDTPTAANILTGKKAYVNGSLVTGTMANNGATGGTISAKAGTVTIPAGYTSGGSVSISSTEQAKIISGNIKSGVTILGVEGSSSVVDTTVSEADTPTAANILSGKKAYVNGSLVTGTMANNGSTSATMDGLTVTSVTIPAGYTSGGTVSLTDDIETALAAI